MMYENVMRKWPLFCWLLGLVLCIGSAAGQFIQNGDFEIGTVSQSPSQWNALQSDGSILISSSRVSPFTNTYVSASAKSVYATDSMFSASLPRIEQTFSAGEETRWNIRFDFFVNGTGHLWRIVLGNPDMSNVLGEYYVGSAFYVNKTHISSLSTQVWYQVEAIIDRATGYQTGKLSRWDNGAAIVVTSWSDQSPLSSFNPELPVNTLWVADCETNASSIAPPTFFDNISVRAVQCGDTGTEISSDIGSAAGVGYDYRDCRVDLYDLAALAENWLFSTAPYGEDSLILSHNGVARYIIVYGDDAIAAEINAANELKTYLNLISGANFKVYKESQAPSHLPCIFVGKSNSSQAMLGGFNLNRLDTDGIVIKTAGPQLVIAGGRPRGTLYAVYTFLEDYLGVRWWTSSESDVPTSPTIVIDSIDRWYKPQFWYREILYRDTLSFNFLNYWNRDFNRGLFGIRNKINGHFNIMEDQWGGYNGILGQVHTFYRFLPPETYFDPHPEWYSWHFNMRHPDSQLCLANNTGMQTEFSNNVILDCQKSENQIYDIVAVSMRDNHRRCLCSLCLASDAYYGGKPAGTLIHFVNQTAAAMKAAGLTKKVITHAYYYNSAPPTANIEKPRDDVVVQYCSSAADQYRSWLHEANAYTQSEFMGWANMKMKNLFIWSYHGWLCNLLLPHPNIEIFAEDIRNWKQNGVKGVLIEGAAYNFAGDFNALRVWLLSKLLWDPSKNEALLINEFMDGYYGDASPYLKSYRSLLRQAWLDKCRYMSYRGSYDYAFVSLELMNQAEALFNQAENAVASNPTLLKRVQRERLPLTLLWLERYYELKQESQTTGIPFNGPADLLAAINNYETAIKDPVNDINIVFSNETIDQMLLRLRDKAILGQPPLPAALPTGQKDIQENDFFLSNYGNDVKLISDSSASNQRSIQVFDKYSWSLRYPLLDGGTFKVYARLKVQKKQGAASSANAFIFGIFDLMPYDYITNQMKTCGQVSDGTYQTHYFGQFTITGGGRQFIFITPPSTNSGVDNIFVDRIILEKVN